MEKKHKKWLLIGGIAASVLTVTVPMAIIADRMIYENKGLKLTKFENIGYKEHPLYQTVYYFMKLTFNRNVALDFESIYDEFEIASCHNNSITIFDMHSKGSTFASGDHIYWIDAYSTSSRESSVLTTWLKMNVTNNEITSVTYNNDMWKL